MKNIKLAVLVIAASALAVSCKKNDDSTTTPASSSCQVTKITTDTTDYTTIEYNSAGKVTKVTDYSNNVISETKSVQYNGSSVVLTRTDGSGNTVGTGNGTINSMGYASRVIYQSTGSTDKDTSDYTYDGNGYLTTEISHGTYSIGSGTVVHSYDRTVHTISGGNRVLSYFYQGTSTTPYQTVTYEYTTTPNKSSFNEEGFNMLGKPNTNLVKKSTSTSGSWVSTTENVYETDSKGYVTKQTETMSDGSASGTQTSVKKFFYNCK